MSSINSRIGELVEELHVTKTAFAESLNVSQQYISKLIKTGNPSDMFISAICEKYSVREDWLRNGNGPMFKQLSRDEEIASFIGEVLKDENDTFKKRFISMLSKLDVSDWETLEKMAELLAEKKEQADDLPQE